MLHPKVYTVLFWSGYYGVILFFTLSGYLITTSILNRWKELSKIELKKFYLFRFARIIPPLAGLLLILAVLHVEGVSGFVIDQEKTSLGYAAFAALTFHFNWLEMKVGYLPGNWDILWTISIEEVFYFIFPVVCLLLKKKWQLIVALAVLLFIAPWCRTHLFLDNELGDRNNFAYMDTIAIGCLTAVIANKCRLSKTVTRVSLILGWLMILFIFAFRNITFKHGITGLGLDLTILSLGVALVIVWMHERHLAGAEKNRVAFRWIRSMGIYSYEIYLTHMFVVIGAAGLYKYIHPGERYLPLFIGGAIALCYVLGKVVFTYYSEPLNKRLRNLTVEDNKVQLIR